MNKIKHTILASLWLVLMAALWLTATGCSAGKKTTTATKLATAKRYTRPATKETSEEKLKVETLIIAAKTQQEVGNTEEAEKIYRQILMIDPKCPAASYELSRIMAANGVLDSAIAYGRTATELGKGNVWYKLHLASLYRYMNKSDELAALWEEIVKENPDVIDYYYELSNAYLQKGDSKKAIATLNRVEKKYGISEPVSLQKAKIWEKEGNEEKALAEMEKLADAMPQNGRYNGVLAESYMAAKKYKKAKFYYDRVLASNPDDEYIHFSLAEYYKVTGDQQKAYEELKSGFGQDHLTTTNKLQILTNFYTSEEFYGKYSKYAFDLLNTIMLTSDDSTTYAAFYGDVLMRQHRLDEAAHQFTLALSTDSSKYEVWEALLICELQGNTDTALLAAHAKRASELFPLHPLPYYIRGVLAYDRHNYEEAIAMGSRCEMMGFTDGYLEPETYELMADSYNRLNNIKCKQYYERYLVLRPNDVNMLNSYAYLLATQNIELGTAERISAATLKAEPNNPYFLDTYAWILYKLGKYPEALIQIKRALANMQTEDPEIRKHFEEIQKAAGN